MFYLDSFRSITRWTTAAAFCLALVGSTVASSQSGQKGNQYVNGLEGIDGASLPPAGLYLRWYNLYYNTDVDNDAAGKAEPINLQVGVFATVPRMIWVTPKKIAGGDVIFAGLVPITYQTVKIGAASIADHGTHLGDVDLTTLLAWHPKRADLAAGADWILPTGAWSATSQVKPGGDEYTIMPDLGAVYYFDKNKVNDLSVLARFEYHTNKRHQDVHMGDDLHFEWGAAHVVKPGFKAGVSGYAQWKVTDDTGKDVSWVGTDHDRVFAAGPELMLPLPHSHFMANIRGGAEFGARSRTAGQYFTLILTKRM